jgi:hypothetical protein
VLDLKENKKYLPKSMPCGHFPGTPCPCKDRKYCTDEDITKGQAFNKRWVEAE